MLWCLSACLCLCICESSIVSPCFGARTFCHQVSIDWRCCNDEYLKGNNSIVPFTFDEAYCRRQTHFITMTFFSVALSFGLHIFGEFDSGGGGDNTNAMKKLMVETIGCHGTRIWLSLWNCHHSANLASNRHFFYA